MTALGDDSPPPAAALWAKYVGDEGPESYMMQGMALHMMYRIIAGGGFAVGVTALGPDVATLTTGLLWAVVYGLVLTVVGAIFWMRVVLAMAPSLRCSALPGLRRDYRARSRGGLCPHDSRGDRR